MTRPAGVPNKNKRSLKRLLKEQYGEDFHPIMQMAKNADRAQKLIDAYEGDEQTLFAGLKFAVDAWDKIAQYTEPKLKAVEVSGSIDIPIVRLTDLTGDDDDN